MSLNAYNKKIVVYDKTNFGIICSADSDSHAAALCMAQVNLTWTSLSHVNSQDLKMQTSNYDTVDRHFQLMTFNNDLEVRLLPEQLTTHEWINFRELMFIKAKYLRDLEISLRIIKKRVCVFYAMDSVMPYIFSIIQKSDPKNNIYHNGVIEYASIQDIDPESAYNELVVYTENYGIVHLRNYALFLKHSKKIAMAESESEVDELYHLAIKDVM